MEKKQNTFVKIGKTIGLILWSSVPLLLVSIAIGNQQKTPVFFKYIVVSIIVAFILFTIRRLWEYYRKNSQDFVQKIRAKDVGIAILLLLLISVISNIGLNLNNYFFDSATTSNQAALEFDNPLAIFPPYFIVFSLITIIVAPIMEELVFRGIFVSMWFRPDQKWLPAFVTSAIFSLMHGFDNIITFFIYFSMGMVLYFAYYRRRNIKDSIVLHILNNGIAFLPALISYFQLLLN